MQCTGLCQENTINKLVRYSGYVPNTNRLKLIRLRRGWFDTYLEYNYKTSPLEIVGSIVTNVQITMGEIITRDGNCPTPLEPLRFKDS